MLYKNNNIEVAKLKSNFRLVMTNFDPKTKGNFAEIWKKKSIFFVLGLWIISIRLSPYKIGDVLLNGF